MSIAALSLVACGGPEEGTENGGEGGGGFITQTYTKIYVDASATGWEQIGVYSWIDGEGELAGGWPGTEVTTLTEEVEGVTYLVWDGAPVGKEIGFIVNDFGAGQQTKDLIINVVEEGHVVVLTEAGADGKWLATIDGEELEVKPAPTTSLDGYTWSVLGAFNGWSDVVMEIVDGWAVATFDNVADANGSFGFKVRADKNWDHNYGIEEGAEVPTDGTEFVAVYNGKDIIVEEGNYTISFKLNPEGDGNGIFKLVKNN